MKIKRTEIKKLFWETAICIDCGAEMKMTLKYLASDPPQFEYKCPVCGKTEFSSENLPRMKAEFVEEVENEQTIKSNCNLQEK